MFREKIKVVRLIESLCLLAGIVGALVGLYKIAGLDKKFAEARNVQRSISVETIIDAVYTYQAQSGSPLSSLGSIKECSQSSSKIGNGQVNGYSFTQVKKIDISVIPFTVSN